MLLQPFFNGINPFYGAPTFTPHSFHVAAVEGGLAPYDGVNASHDTFGKQDSSAGMTSFSDTCDRTNGDRYSLSGNRGLHL